MMNGLTITCTGRGRKLDWFHWHGLGRSGDGDVRHEGGTS